jgi:hypothetical protein
MLKNFYIFIFLLICFFAFGCKPSSNSEENQVISNSGLEKESLVDSIPVEFDTIRTGEEILISVQVASGFGIQMEAPNKLEVESLDGVQILSADLNLKGTANPDKPEYFLNIQPLKIQIRGNSGKISLKGKLFYCDYRKNICLPGKVSRVLSISG